MKSLPDVAVQQVLAYALSLKPQPPVKRPAHKPARRTVDGDAEWERIIADKRPRPKLEAMVAEVERQVATGKSEPLDLRRL